MLIPAINPQIEVRRARLFVDGRADDELDSRPEVTKVGEIGRIQVIVLLKFSALVLSQVAAGELHSDLSMDISINWRQFEPFTLWQELLSGISFKGGKHYPGQNNLTGEV